MIEIPIQYDKSKGKFKTSGSFFDKSPAFNAGYTLDPFVYREYGRTITLKRFKEMVLFTLLVLCVFIAIAAGLFLWNRNILKEKNQLESHLKNIEERNEALRHEKDILMTRLVVAESRVQETRVHVPEKQADGKYADQPEQDLSSSEESASLGGASAETEVQEQAQPEQDNDQPGLGIECVH